MTAAHDPDPRDKPRSAPEPRVVIELLDQILEQPEPKARQAELTELVHSLRPEDIADVLAHYSREQKLEIFPSLPEEDAPQVIDETDPETTRNLVDSLSTPDISRLVELMPPDEATDLIADLPGEKKELVLEDLEPKTASEVRKLLQHHPESAGGIMTSDFIVVEATKSAQEVLDHVQRTLDSEVVSYVYVIDDQGRLEGVFSIRDLLKAKPEEQIANFMTTEVIFAEVNDDQEKVATLARKYNLSSVPILDEQEHLVGVVTVDDILDILSEEADEDIYRMAGTADSHPAQQKVWRRALIRIPWLFMPVISGFVIAAMHTKSGDNSETARTVGEVLTLAAFIPLVMGIAGAVGTQCAIMMVRGMATGDIERGRGRKVFVQELGIGAIISLAIGGVVTALLASLLSTEIISGAPALAWAVGLGLSGGIILASIFGTAFPIACKSIGLDPALVAGPFITSLNDIVAAAVYLGIAQIVLRSFGS